MLGRCQKFTPKSSNIVELMTALLSIWNDLPHEFIDKAILSFQKRLRSCVAAAGGHFEHNIQFKYPGGSWHSSFKRLNCWRIKCAKFIAIISCYYWKFRTRLRVYEKWTFILLYLVILIKFAKYVVWILFCKRCKFGEKNLQQFQRYRIFPTGFFGAPYNACISTLPNSWYFISFQTFIKKFG